MLDSLLRISGYVHVPTYYLLVNLHTKVALIRFLKIPFPLHAGKGGKSFYVLTWTCYSHSVLGPILLLLEPVLKAGLPRSSLSMRGNRSICTHPYLYLLLPIYMYELFMAALRNSVAILLTRAPPRFNSVEYICKKIAN